MAIRISQINMARSFCGMNELMTIIEQRRLDVLFIQEPYQRPLAWPGFRVYTGVPPTAEMWSLTIVREASINVVQIQDC